MRVLSVKDNTLTRVFPFWQRYTILIQLHTLSLVIVKKLNILHTPKANLHTPTTAR